MFRLRDSGSADGQGLAKLRVEILVRAFFAVGGEDADCRVEVKNLDYLISSGEEPHSPPLTAGLRPSLSLSLSL